MRMTAAFLDGRPAFTEQQSRSFTIWQAVIERGARVPPASARGSRRPGYTLFSSASSAAQAAISASNDMASPTINSSANMAA